jgi:hypothetical protein
MWSPRSALLLPLATLSAIAGTTAGDSVAVDGGFDYVRKDAGMWDPPSPPAHEVAHLKGAAFVPAPEITELEISAWESAAAAGVRTRKRQRHARALLQDDASAGGLEPQKVPHNWFGSGIYVAPKFAIATGKEECDVCMAMIHDAAAESGGVTLSPQLAGSEAQPAEPQGPAAAGKLDLCSSMTVNFKATCKGYSNYLQDCPSFVHNICHEDIGGSERLRSPCPDYLKCYYCLRINPLFCLDFSADTCS